MADWRKVALAALLSDGKIDDNEVRILKRQLAEDGRIDRKEVEFLAELRNEAQKRAKGAKLNAGFEKFFFDAVHLNVVTNGIISSNETRWLKKMLYADKKIDDSEKKFLVRLKKAAKKTNPAFEALYKQCMGK